MGVAMRSSSCSMSGEFVSMNLLKVLLMWKFSLPVCVECHFPTTLYSPTHKHQLPPSSITTIPSIHVSSLLHFIPLLFLLHLSLTSVLTVYLLLATSFPLFSKLLSLIDLPYYSAQCLFSHLPHSPLTHSCSHSPSHSPLTGNRDKDGSLDWLQERLQDAVPLVHGDHLVGVQTDLRQGARLPGVQGKTNPTNTLLIGKASNSFYMCDILVYNWKLFRCVFQLVVLLHLKHWCCIGKWWGSYTLCTLVETPVVCTFIV